MDKISFYKGGRDFRQKYLYCFYAMVYFPLTYFLLVHKKETWEDLFWMFFIPGLVAFIIVLRERGYSLRKMLSKDIVTISEEGITFFEEEVKKTTISWDQFKDCHVHIVQYYIPVVVTFYFYSKRENVCFGELNISFFNKSIFLKSLKKHVPKDHKFYQVCKLYYPNVLGK